MNQFPRFELSGKVALVTASARGLGRAIALALAHAGADVALGLRDASAHGGLPSEIEALGRRALPLQMDVMSLEQIFRAIQDTVSHFGRLDILVNNAGIAPENLAENVREEDYDSTVAVNLKGTFFASQAAGRVTIRQKSGCIINVSSQAGFVALPTESVIVDETGEVVVEGSFASTKKSLDQVFGALARCRVALEVGTHWPWMSRQLTRLGHEVIVANARSVRLIGESSRKDDKLDARMLARLARIDPQLLSPIRHRSEQAQADLMSVRARAALVEVRTALINTARGLVKSYGARLPSCASYQVCEELAGSLPVALQVALGPLLAEIDSLTERIREYDEQLDEMSRERYPEVALLKQVQGVGTLIALTFVLTVEDPYRFRKSRDAACYVGLRPKRRESGQSRPQLGISKEGDSYLRKLLVQGAHYILGRHGQDSELGRWGLGLAVRGGTPEAARFSKGFDMLNELSATA